MSDSAWRLTIEWISTICILIAGIGWGLMPGLAEMAKKRMKP